MFEPLPERIGDERPDFRLILGPRKRRKQRKLEADACPRVVALLRANASLARIREQLLTGCSHDAVREAVVNCAATNEFAQATVDVMPSALTQTVEQLLSAWRGQPLAVSTRERFATLRRLLVGFDDLAMTVDAMRAGAMESP